MKKNVLDYYGQYFHWKISTVMLALLFFGFYIHEMFFIIATNQIFKTVHLFLCIHCYIFVIYLWVGIDMNIVLMCIF